MDQSILDCDFYEQRDYINFVNKKNRDYFIRFGKERTACVVTYGCQQNVADSEKIKGILAKMGYKQA